MISKDWTRFTTITVVLVIVTIVYSLLSGNFQISYLLAWILSILIHQYILGLQLVKVRELRRNRNNWLKRILKIKLGNSPQLSHFIAKITETDSNFSEEELAIKQRDEMYTSLPPDIAIAERELIKLEERSSIVLTSAVFIPVLFSLAHIFRYVAPENVIIEIITALTLTQALSLYYNKAIRLEGWSESLLDFERIEDELLSRGQQALFSIPDYYRNVSSIELGVDPEIREEIPAKTAVASTALIVCRLPSEDREDVINTFKTSTESLPVKEELMAVRWKALSGRALLVTTIGVAITGMFAGIASFSFPKIFEQIEVVRPTEYLSIFLFVLVIVTSLLIMRAWLSKRQLLRWTLAWITVYWITFFSVQIFVY